MNNFQWNWHVNYIYADHVAPLLPQGTTLVITAWHDNTADNPNNPDPVPAQPVNATPRSVLDAVQLERVNPEQEGHGSKGRVHRVTP